MLPSNVAQKVMNCVTFYKYLNSILNDKAYSVSIIGPVSVTICSIFLIGKCILFLLNNKDSLWS